MKIFLAMLLAISVVFVLAGCGEKKTEEAESPSTPPTEEKATQPAPPTNETKTAEQKPQTTKDGFIVTKSGLKYKDIKIGAGPAVKAGDTVAVQYKGYLDNGTVFDTTKQPGRGPFSFTVGAGRVIKGWDEGLQGMKKGGKRQLIIPSELGYGSEDMGTIPPNSTLHFDIELLKIGA